MHKMEFSKAISKLRRALLKEPEILDRIKFIFSRDIKKNSDLIDCFVQIIKYNIFLYNEIFSPNFYGIHLITDGKLYLLFLLNTDFSVRMKKCFTLDSLNSHNMIGYLPTLSPYVFIQVIWQLHYERLLTHSLLQIPLDLCVEIIEITIKCINELNAERAVELLLNLCHKIYCKFLLFYHCALSSTVIGSVICTNRLVTSFQTIMNMLEKMSCFSMLSNQENYKQHGHILISIFNNLHKRAKIDIELEEIKRCDITFVNEFTYGRMKHHKKLSDYEVMFIAKMLEQKMIDFLIKEMKKVDRNEFMGWAEIQCTECNEVNLNSMQHTFIITCYLTVKFIINKFIPYNEHLCQCLQQFLDLDQENSSKHTLTLQDLCHEIDNGKPEKIKKLLMSCEKWDQRTLLFVNERIHLLNKVDNRILLKYIYHMFQYPKCDLRKYMETIYLQLLKVMLQQSIEEMYNTVYQYTAMHYLDNPIWYLYSQKQFETFMASKGSIQNPEKLRILLIFILLNAEKTLTTVFAIVIGTIKYEHINTVSIKDMFVLYNFFSIKVYKKFTILTIILKKILECNLNFNNIDCMKFLKILLSNKVLNSDNLMNQVYIPYLNGKLYLYNLSTVLIQIEYVLNIGKCTKETNYTLLIITLIKMILFIKKYSISNIQTMNMRVVMHILRIILNIQDMLTITQNNVIITLQRQIEPIDKMQVMELYKQFDVNSNIFVITMKEYETRCFSIYRQLRNARNDILMFNYAHSFRLDHEVFMRHMIISLTNDESKEFAYEVIKRCSYFGWHNEWRAFENILRIIAETVQIVLIFPHDFPQDTFQMLMHKIIIISYNFTNTRSVNLEKIHNLMLKIMFSLKKAISITRYNKMYKVLLEYIKDISLDKYEKCKKYFSEISKIMNICLIKTDDDSKKNTIFLNYDVNNMYGRSYMEVADMYRAYIFVCECINMPVPVKIPINQQIRAFHFSYQIKDNILRALEYYYNSKMKHKCKRVKRYCVTLF